MKRNSEMQVDCINQNSSLVGTIKADKVKRENHFSRHFHSAAQRCVHTFRKLRTRKLVKAAPGVMLYSALKFLYPRKTFERVIEPTISDFWHEYPEVLAQGNIKRARWMHCQLYLTMFKALLLDAALKLISRSPSHKIDSDK